MTATERLVSEHIREYESRLKHIDELFERARQASEKLDEDHALKTELDEYAQQRADLAREAERIKKMPLDQWRKEMVKTSGPMAIWDILAQKLEDLTERLD
jgi:DNA repair exonuclease SbcCD ATPase subunit